MIILHLSHTDIRSDSRILKEMNSLLSLNGSNKICGLGIKDDNSRTVNMGPELQIECIELVSRKLSLFRPLRLTLVYCEIFFRVLSFSLRIRPDVIHCHDVPMLPVAVCVKSFTGAKLIYDIHELESQQTGSSRLAQALILGTEKLAWWAVDALVSVNQSIQQWYFDKLGRKSSEVILNAPVVSADYKAKFSPYLKQRFDIPAESKVFLYSGLLTKGRGLELLVRVFERNDIKSHIVFLGYGDLFDELMLLSRSNNKVHVHEAVPYSRVVEVASGADVGMCLVQNFSLSNYYCLPNKLFEYAFAGVRVLASNLPEVVRVVEAYKLGECVDLNEEDLVRAIHKLEAEPAQDRKVNEALVREMSWAAQERKLLKLYQSL